MSFTRMPRQQQRMLEEVVSMWHRYGPVLRDRAALAGGMAWKTVKGREYLVHYRYDPLTGSKRFTSRGLRSPETERLLEQFKRRRLAVDAEMEVLEQQADLMAKVAKVSELGRMPTRAGDVLRSLWAEGLAGEGLFVVGGAAMFAFEADAFAMFDDDLVSIQGLDLVIDSSSRIEEALTAVRRIEKRFAHAGDRRLEMPDGFYVEILSRDGLQDRFDALDGLDGAQSEAVDWALRCEPWDALCVARDGSSVPMAVCDPRSFSILAAASQAAKPSEETKMRMRQAIAVAQLVADGWREPFHSRHAAAFDELDFADPGDFGRLRA